MANELAFHAVGEALRVYLQSAYPTALQEKYPCTFSVISTGQLAKFDDPNDSTVALTFFLYRTTVSEHLRNSFQPGRAPPDHLPALPLELHWMMSVWATGAPAEQVVFAWAMAQIARMPVLDSSTLIDASWDPGDMVQVLPEELPIEDVMRIWDAIEPSYRLSTTYVARVVRLDLPSANPPKMITRRFVVQTRPREEQP